MIYGTFLRKRLQNGDECEMTWSSIRFMVLPNPSPREWWWEANRYQMLKFTDGRDERYSHVVDYKRPYKEQDRTTFHVKKDVNWCLPRNPNGKPGRIVMYVPGHEGTYMQARSLGAHGTTLTRHGHDVSQKDVNHILDRVWDGSMNATAENVKDFLFDVYAVDFGGEGGGLHGSRLFAQAEFLGNALERIAEECGFGGKTDEQDDIVIVAHSIGGLVARKAAFSVNRKREMFGKDPLVKKLITLASPHGGIPFLFDSSVYRFHKNITMQESLQDEKTRNLGKKHNHLVSISGGLRDELIPPSSCRVPSIMTNSISVLATNVAIHEKYVAERFGMDHNAIVWCHGVLSFVREIIHADTYENTLQLIRNKRKVTTANDDVCNFECQNREKEMLLQKEYGSFGAFTIISSMVYNSWLLVMLYVVNGILHHQYLRRCRCRCVLIDISVICAYLFVPIGSSTIVFWSVGKSYVGFGVTLMLAFNAMNVYYAIMHGVFPAASFMIHHMSKPYAEIAVTHRFHTVNGTGRCDQKNVTWQALVKLFLKHGLSLVIMAVASFIFLWICSAFVFKDVFVVNAMSVGSLIFLVYSISTMIHIIRLGIPGSWNMGELGLTERSLASILVVLFPILTAGKIVFALSLLTAKGQFKALPYLEFERLEWDSLCQGRMICEIFFFLQYDLVRYMVVLSLPIHLSIMWMIQGKEYDNKYRAKKYR